MYSGGRALFCILPTEEEEYSQLYPFPCMTPAVAQVTRQTAPWLSAAQTLNAPQRTTTLTCEDPIKTSSPVTGQLTRAQRNFNGKTGSGWTLKQEALQLDSGRR